MSDNAGHRFGQHQARVAAQRAQAKVQSGVIPPRDRFGNAIQPGDLVVYHPPVDLVFQVKDVKPVMDPRAPQGLVNVVLVVEVPVGVNVSQVTGNFIRVGRIQEQVEAGESVSESSAEEPTSETPPDVPPAIALTDAPA